MFQLSLGNLAVHRNTLVLREKALDQTQGQERVLFQLHRNKCHLFRKIKIKNPKVVFGNESWMFSKFFFHTYNALLSQLTASANITVVSLTQLKFGREPSPSGLWLLAHALVKAILIIYGGLVHETKRCVDVLISVPLHARPCGTPLKIASIC